jgi:hypothetical protein
MNGRDLTALSEIESPRPVGPFLAPLPEDDNGFRFTPRAFLDVRGRLTFKAHGVRELLLFLSQISQILGNCQGEERSQLSSEGRIELRAFMRIDTVQVERCIAKIGVNFAAMVFGADFVRHESFDEIKAYVMGDLHNTPEESTMHVRNAGPAKIFPFELDRSNHWLMMWNRRDDTLDFALSLYGGDSYLVRLANRRRPRVVERPLDIACINYAATSGRILRMTELEERVVAALDRPYGADHTP